MRKRGRECKEMIDREKPKRKIKIKRGMEKVGGRRKFGRKKGKRKIGIKQQ